MNKLFRQIAVLLVAATTLVAVACDDGGGVESTGSSGSVSATGLTASGLKTTTDNPLVQEAVTSYKAYVISQIDTMIASVGTFTDAVRANNITAAKAAY